MKVNWLIIQKIKSTSVLILSDPKSNHLTLPKVLKKRGKLDVKASLPSAGFLASSSSTDTGKLGFLVGSAATDID